MRYWSLEFCAFVAVLQLITLVVPTIYHLTCIAYLVCFLLLRGARVYLLVSHQHICQVWQTLCPQDLCLLPLWVSRGYELKNIMDCHTVKEKKICVVNLVITHWCSAERPSCHGFSCGVENRATGCTDFYRVCITFRFTDITVMLTGRITLLVLLLSIYVFLLAFDMRTVPLCFSHMEIKNKCVAG